MSARRAGIALLALAAVVALLRSAGDAGYWQRYVTAVWRDEPLLEAAQIQPRTRVPGAGRRAPARATPEQEQLAPEAIEAAIDEARALDSRALIVHRHGHRVAEYYAPGFGGDSMASGGELAPLPWLLTLASLADAGRVPPGSPRQWLQTLLAAQDSPGWRNPWSAQARQRFSLRGAAPGFELPSPGRPAALIAEQVWAPLGAEEAAIGGADAEGFPECCFVAQLDDWMRLADLLLQEGRYAGEFIVSPEWLRELMPGGVGTPRVPVWRTGDSRWSGDEPPAANQATWVDLEPDLRLWLLPQRGLAVLHWARRGSGEAADTRLSNIVIRGMVDAPAATEVNRLEQMVPGH